MKYALSDKDRLMRSSKTYWILDVRNLHIVDEANESDIFNDDVEMTPPTDVAL